MVQAPVTKMSDSIEDVTTVFMKKNKVKFYRFAQ